MNQLRNRYKKSQVSMFHDVVTLETLLKKNVTKNNVTQYITIDV